MKGTGRKAGRNQRARLGRDFSALLQVQQGWMDGADVWMQNLKNHLKNANDRAFYAVTIRETNLKYGSIIFQWE